MEVLKDANDKQKIERISDDSLWLTLKVKDQLYAIDSKYVDSIFELHQEITKLPDAGINILGAIPVREKVVPLMDLRMALGIESLEQEQMEFEDMLEMRKHDHINWVDELKRCLAANEEFKLATDPHKCAFGKWYDNYQPTNHSVAFHLRKIEEPHKKLHQSAHDAFACTKDCENCSRQECLEKILKRETEVYMQRVVGLIEEAKDVFKESYKKMCVVISDENNTVAILVDEVLAVETLKSMVKGSGVYTQNGVSIISYIAQRHEGNKQTLILNPEALLQNN